MWKNEFAPFLDDQKLHDLEEQENHGAIVDYLDALQNPRWKKEVYQGLQSIRTEADLTRITDVFALYKKHKPTIRTKDAQIREDTERARLQKNLLDSIGNVGALALSKENAIKLEECLLAH